MEGALVSPIIFNSLYTASLHLDISLTGVIVFGSMSIVVGTSAVLMAIVPDEYLPFGHRIISTTESGLYSGIRPGGPILDQAHGTATIATGQDDHGMIA